MSRKLYKMDDSKLRRHMRIAAGNGVDTPTFRIGPYTFIRWSSGTLGENNRIRQKIMVFVSKGDEHLGRIEAKRFRPKNGCALDDVRNLRKILEHPKEAASAAASVTDHPICACCSRPIASLDPPIGIGENCRQLWGFK